MVSNNCSVVTSTGTYSFWFFNSQSLVDAFCLQEGCTYERTYLGEKIQFMFSLINVD